MYSSVSYQLTTSAYFQEVAIHAEQVKEVAESPTQNKTSATVFYQPRIPTPSVSTSWAISCPPVPAGSHPHKS